MFFLRTGQSSPGANAIVAALALLVVANPKFDVMAQGDTTSSTLPIRGGPDADGCIPGTLR